MVNEKQHNRRAQVRFTKITCAVQDMEDLGYDLHPTT